MLPKKTVEYLENPHGVKIYQDPSIKEPITPASWKWMIDNKYLFFVRLKAKKMPKGVIVPLTADVIREQRRMRYSELLVLAKEDKNKDINWLNDDDLRVRINNLKGYPSSATYKEQDNLFTHSEKHEEYAQDIQRWAKIVHENKNYQQWQTQPSLN